MGLKTVLVMLLFYLLASSVVVSSSMTVEATKMPLPETTEDESSKPLMDDSETVGSDKQFRVSAEDYELLKSFIASGMNLADVVRELNRLREATRIEMDRNIKLERHLKQERETCKEQSLPQEKHECSWWAWWCIEPEMTLDKPEAEEEVLIVKGCTDVICCLSLIWQLTLQLGIQFIVLMKKLITDPLQFAPTEYYHAGASTMIGIFIAFLGLNLAAFIYQEFTNLWNALGELLKTFLKLPLFSVMGDWLDWIWTRSKKNAEKGKKKEKTEESNDEIPELKRMIQDLKRHQDKREMSEIKDILAQMVAQMKEKTKKSSIPIQQRQVMPQRTQSPRPPSPRGTPTKCPDCGRAHTGKCWRTNACTLCGQFGMCIHRRQNPWLYRQQMQGQVPSPALKVNLCDQQSQHEDTASSTDMTPLIEQLTARIEQLEKKPDEETQSCISLSPSERPTPARVTSLQDTANHLCQVKGRVGGDQQLRAFLLDTGADCNVMPMPICQKLGLVIQSSSTDSVLGVGNQSIGVKGKVVAHTQIGNEDIELEYLVVDGNDRLIIGGQGLSAMGITINCSDKTISTSSGGKVACLFLQKN